MDKSEIRGLLKGIGAAMIVSAAIFYAVVINLRTGYETKVTTNEEIVTKARSLGMIYLTDATTSHDLSDEEIIEAAKKLGMVFEAAQ